jgi:hypothetical protein
VTNGIVEAVKTARKRNSKAEAERAVTAVISAVKVGVKKDKMVQLVGFGTFRWPKKSGKGLIRDSPAHPDSKSRPSSSSGKDSKQSLGFEGIQGNNFPPATEKTRLATPAGQVFSLHREYGYLPLTRYYDVL